MPSSRGRNSPNGKGGGGRAILAAGNGREESVSGIESPVVIAALVASLRKGFPDRQQVIVDTLQMPKNPVDHHPGESRKNGRQRIGGNEKGKGREQTGEYYRAHPGQFFLVWLYRHFHSLFTGYALVL